MQLPAGPITPEKPEPHVWPDYRYDHGNWLDSTSFDWIEQPLAAISDAFFDFITHHHDPVRHPRSHRCP